jgi:hypothetical protein
VEAEDPGSLSAADVDAISARTGVNLRTRLAAELRSCYDAFLESSIPPGATPLTGEESGRIRSFRDALGLTDEDAAPVHIDVGRRFMRARFEASSRAGDAAGRAALAKLIYVSSLVYGEQKAAFLLPWRRVFDLSDAQLYVAKRDCARGLVRRWVAEKGSAGGGLVADAAWLAGLEAARQGYRLADDTTAEEVKTAARAGLEARLEEALAAASAGPPPAVRRPGDAVPGLAQLRAAAAYSSALAAAAGGPDMPPGLGAATVAGGPLAGGPKASALSGLYRAWLEDALTGEGGAWSADLSTEASALATALALTPTDAARIREGVAARAYKASLRAEVASGRLDGAPSKAAVLGALCERFGFDPAAAADMHRTIYRQKVDTLLAKGSLTDADAATLDRLRVLLCVPRPDVEAVQADTAGKIYAAAVADALAAGADAFSPQDAAAVTSARAAVRLDAGIARGILGAAARKAFLAFITKSRSAKTREAQGKELRDLVVFSNVVVAPLFRDVRTTEEEEADDRAAALLEAQEAMAEAQAATAKEDAAGSSSSSSSSSPTPSRAAPALDTGAVGMSKADTDAAAGKPGGAGGASTKAAAKDAGARGQTGITLADDLPRTDRIETYRNFLLWCLSGEEVVLPMGGTMTVQRDASEFTRLQQLGAVLGLGPADVAGVQGDLAQEAFRSQVQGAVSGAGGLDPAKAAELEATATQMGLTKDAAAGVIKSVQAERVAGGLKAAGDRGALTLQALLDMKDAGVDLAAAVKADTRQALYTAALGNALKDGSGDLSAEKWMVDLPATLGLEPAKCAAVAAGLAKDKRRTTLVQAVSHLRQGDRAAAARDLANLLSCERASPAGGPLAWGVPSEMESLYGAFAGSVGDAGKRSEVAAMLGLSADTAAAVEAASAAAGAAGAAEAADEEALF